MSSSDPTAPARRMAPPGSPERAPGQPNAVPIRLVGPGRRTIAAEERVRELEMKVSRLSAELGRTRRELGLAQLVERGAQRRLDRLEAQLAHGVEQGRIALRS